MVAVLTGLRGVAVDTAILLLIRNVRLYTANGRGWLLVAGLFAALGLAPGIFDMPANLPGIAYPPALALTLAVGAIVVKLLLDDIQYSRLRVRHQRLAQRMALLETELRRLREQRGSSDSKSAGKKAS